MTNDDSLTTGTTAEQSNIDATTWRPARTSTVFVVVGTLAVSLLLAVTLGPTVSTVPPTSEPGIYGRFGLRA